MVITGFVRLNRQARADQQGPRLSRGELTPLGQSSSTILFENITAVEVTVVVEVVVDRGMGGSKFLQGLDWSSPTELVHRYC